jgi:hypothetical protein
MNWRVFISIALLLGLLASNAVAQIETEEGPSGIQVSPAIEELEVPAGQKFSRTLDVVNTVDRTITFYPQVLNFHTDNQEGKPTFFSSQERYSRFAASSWVSFSVESFTIEPNERLKVDYSIEVPDDALAGGRYGAILFSTEQPQLGEQDTEVGLVGLIGTLLMLTVPGQIQEQMVIEDFSAPSFLIRPPAEFSILMGNYGGTHVKPKGGITIKNWFNKNRDFLEVNQTEASILPDSKRRFDSLMDFDWTAVGRYTATANFSYGTNGTVTEFRTFYIIPIWLLVTKGLLLLAIIIYLSSRGRRKGRTVLPPNTLPPPAGGPPRPRPIIR